MAARLPEMRGADVSDDDEMRRLFEHHQLVEHRRLGPALDREAWIAVARRIFSPGERQPCCVCGKFKSIAQAHHVVPLTAQYDRGFRLPDQAFVWLCPNHHAMVHLFILSDDRSLALPAMEARAKTTSSLNEDLSEDEFGRLMELMQWSARSPG